MENNYWSYALTNDTDFTERYPYESNCIENWTIIEDKVVHDVIKNKYWISTFGRVASLSFPTTKRYKILVPRTSNKRNIPTVPLFTINGGCKIARIDYLVLMSYCYIDLMDPKYYDIAQSYSSRLVMNIKHLDGDIGNNMLTNLQWYREPYWADNFMGKIENAKKVKSRSELEPLRVL